MKPLNLVYKLLLAWPILHSSLNIDQREPKKSSEEIEILPGYDYELVGEVPYSVYEEAFHEYDWTGDGIADEYGPDQEGNVSLWDGLGDTLIGKFLEIEDGSIGNLRVKINKETGQPDLLGKYEYDDTVKVLLYRNKVEIKPDKPK